MAGLQDLVDWLHKTELRNKVIKIVCDNESCVNGLQKRNMSLVDLDKAESDLMQDIIQKLKFSGHNNRVGARPPGRRYPLR